MQAPPTPTALPVQPLAYSDAAADLAGGERPGVPPGFASVTIILGASLLLGHGWSLLADWTGWSDPFYRKFRTASVTIGIPSVAVLTALAVTHTLCGALQVAGGVGCVRRSRGWARLLLLAYALLEIPATVAGTVTYWIAQQGSRMAYTDFESAGQLLLRLAYTVPGIGVPLLTLLLIRPRRAWSLRRG